MLARQCIGGSAPPATSETRSATAALLLVCAFLVASPPARAQETSDPERLPDTAALTAEEELIDRILDGAGRFLDRQLVAAGEQRRVQWSRILRLPTAERDVELSAHRTRLQAIIGGSDPRTVGAAPEVISSLDGPTTLAHGGGIRVQAVRWPVLDGYAAEGLVVMPDAGEPRATVILLPDADYRAEQLVGLVESSDESAGLPLQLAAAGCRVIVPQPISRQQETRGDRVELTDREYVYRCTYVLGRHPLGLEVQTVRALVDWLRLGPNASQEGGPEEHAQPIAVAGYGEGGLVALLAAAVDTRIDAALASGVWGNRDRVWSEPLSRNVFGLLRDFGDAELACMIGPRPLIIEASEGPEHQIAAAGAAPGRLVSPRREEVTRAVGNTRQIMGDRCQWLQVFEGEEPAFGSVAACSSLLRAVGIQDVKIADRGSLRDELKNAARQALDPQAARRRQLGQIETIAARWIRSSRHGRAEMIEQLDTGSPEIYRRATEPLRERFERDVIGRFEEPLLPPATRSRLWRRNDVWTGWEVEMDVFPELVAGGILLVPNTASADEPRGVVVCVHGLEGLAADTIIGDHQAYRDFAARLCERGFVVFCPQQLYRGRDRFRELQRKANPLGKTLFSLMIPQHRQIVGWLQTLPYVDPDRIAFYGLSYGGKSAMRIPAVVTEYGATICSGDFNEWVLKNASTSDRFSYVWTGEYEIFEFDLAGTFSYAEMAALICPRPFMVERGHFDAVAEDRWVAFEYAPVRHLYAARLGLPERTTIDWFVGPHTINGEATFAFLHRHLDMPKPTEPVAR